jgi:hypothetical protein
MTRLSHLDIGLPHSRLPGTDEQDAKDRLELSVRLCSSFE